MKKVLFVSAFAVIYAIFLSVGFECLLQLAGISMAIALDGRAVNEQYPRFIPFCLAVGLFSLVALVVTFIINLNASKKMKITKMLWCIQMTVAIFVSLPMTILWRLLFEFLQKTF